MSYTVHKLKKKYPQFDLERTLYKTMIEEREMVTEKQMNNTNNTNGNTSNTTKQKNSNIKKG